MRTAYIMGKVQDTAHGVQGNVMPQWRDLRRIPTCYQHRLPLKVMKRYQCVVVGSAQGVLTVAIAAQRGTSIIETLTNLTGRPIFPVWVKTTRLRLLILRVERWTRLKNEMLRWPHLLNLIQIHTIMMVPLTK